MSDDTETYNQLVEIMLSEDDESLAEFVLAESERDDVVASLDGDTTLVNYLYLFEEYLEQHDLYLFAGWETAQIIGHPIVEKFWVTVTVLVGPDADLRGATRIQDAMKQGSVKVKSVDNGHIVQFMILKRNLDKIERVNKEKIEKLSDQALGEL